MANSKTSLSVTPEDMETPENTNNEFGMGTGKEKDEDNLAMPLGIDITCCCCCSTGGSDVMKVEEIIL